MAVTLTVEFILEYRDELLLELGRQQGVVRDYGRSSAYEYSTGFYLFGKPGSAKTFTVLRVLEEEIREPFVYQRGHLTPLGLFELICEYPDRVLVLDDIGAILKSDVALQ